MLSRIDFGQVAPQNWCHWLRLWLLIIFNLLLFLHNGLLSGKINFSVESYKFQLNNKIFSRASIPCYVTNARQLIFCSPDINTTWRVCQQKRFWLLSKSVLWESCKKWIKEKRKQIAKKTKNIDSSSFSKRTFFCQHYIWDPSGFIVHFK